MKKLALIVALLSFGLTEAKMHKKECKAGEPCKIEKKRPAKKCADKKECKNKNHKGKKGRKGHHNKSKKAGAEAQSRRMHLDNKDKKKTRNDVFTKKSGASAQSIRMNHFGKKKTKEGEVN